MTEFETQLLSLLGDIRKEMIIASLPEDYRKYQRELFERKESQKLWDKLTEECEQELQDKMDVYVTEHPEYEGLDYDQTVELQPEFIRLDKKAQGFAKKSVEIDERIEKLCEHYKCVNLYD